MNRTDAATDVLLAALTRPESLVGLAAADWDLLLRQARRTNVHARLAFAALDRGLLEQLPQTVQQHMAAARAVGADHERTIRWEINRIDRALTDLDVPVILLKGAAYVAAELPLARGRLVTDVDIMVPKESLFSVEKALRRHGWESMKLDPYDQRYYRTWMHELPPFMHRERRTVLDVHHTILPETSRLKPDPRKLAEAARALERQQFYVLAPADMVAHGAAHLFHDGDMALALRDLVDLHDLIGRFGDERYFWSQLVLRAHELDLARPLFYALRYASRLLGTPVPEDVTAAAAACAPPMSVLALMDGLVPRVLLPDHPDRPRRASSAAALLLYIRSHWLRMPPLLLAKHLSRKAFMRLKTRPSAATADAHVAQ
ncbi:MAG: nucleotidyltransferase family protein [Alphaproteobacteria bacterium]